MSNDLAVLLQRLVADPAKLASLHSDQQRMLREILEPILDDAPPPPMLVTSEPASSPSPDQDLMTADELAMMLGVSRKWCYAHSCQLPFTRRISRKVLRFARSGALKWLEKQRP